MTPTEKAQLLQAVAEMTRANKEGSTGNYRSISDNCKEVANLILESIRDDLKKEKQQ